MEHEKQQAAAWWMLPEETWNTGKPRRLKHRPSSIPEPNRARVQGAPPREVESAACHRVKQSARYQQPLLLRKLLATDRWYEKFAPEYLPSVRFTRIAAENGLTVAQVINALQLAYELDAEGLL